MFDRYFGIEFQYFDSKSISQSSSYERMRADELNIVKLYYPDIYFLAVLKCKEKLWKLTINNVYDLVHALCKKIEFDISLAVRKASSIQSITHRNEPFAAEHINLYFNTGSSLYTYLFKKLELKRLDNECRSMNEKASSLLIKHDINPDNLAFGSIIDNVKITLKFLRKK